MPSYDPEHVYQWGTLVRPAHRGHRLGLATKVHNLRRFQAGESGRSLLFTYNAEVNTHMIGVNEAMGFRPVQRLGGVPEAALTRARPRRAAGLSSRLSPRRGCAGRTPGSAAGSGSSRR